MTLLVDAFAQLDVILIAIMLSGTIVQMGKHQGTTFWDSHFKGFYLLFAFFIIENILIAIVANYILLPFLDVTLPNNFLKALSLTITLVLTCCMWFIRTFEYSFRRHWVAIICFVASIVATILLFAYT
jgi:hypothetical protein